MISDSLIRAIGKGLEGAIAAHLGTNSPGTARLGEIAKAAKVKGSGSSFVPEAYDAATLLMLALQAAKSAESDKLKDKVLMVANAPGEKFYSGELGKTLKILAGGGKVDYVGASAVELIGPGDTFDAFVKNGRIFNSGLARSFHIGRVRRLRCGAYWMASRPHGSGVVRC